MGRAFFYIVSLCALLAFPVVLFYEFANNYSFLSGPVIRTLVAANKIIVADVAFISELTPAIAALTVAALAPRPLPEYLKFVSLAICVLGYFSYAWITIHLNGETLVLEKSMLGWVEAAIEGHVPQDSFDNAVESIKTICASIRIFYMLIFASVLGFAINKSGLEGKSQ